MFTFIVIYRMPHRVFNSSETNVIFFLSKSVLKYAIIKRYYVHEMNFLSLVTYDNTTFILCFTFFACLNIYSTFIYCLLNGRLLFWQFVLSVWNFFTLTTELNQNSLNVFVRNSLVCIHGGSTERKGVIWPHIFNIRFYMYYVNKIIVTYL